MNEGGDVAVHKYDYRIWVTLLHVQLFVVCTKHNQTLLDLMSCCMC